MTLQLPDVATVQALFSEPHPEALVQAMIDDAAMMADNPCVQGYPATRQAAIVRWLAAHMLASTNRDGVLTSDKLGDAQQSYARATTGEGLRGTTYGQQALLLDFNGCLSRIGKPRATIEVV